MLPRVLLAFEGGRRVAHTIEDKYCVKIQSTHLIISMARLPGDSQSLEVGLKRLIVLYYITIYYIIIIFYCVAGADIQIGCSVLIHSLYNHTQYSHFTLTIYCTYLRGQFKT